MGKAKVSRKMHGELSIQLNKSKLKATYNGIQKAQILNIAIVSIKDSIKITKGENEGKTLQQNFNVINLQSFASTNENKWNIKVKDFNLKNNHQYAIVAWVTTLKSPIVLQAAASLLTNE